MKVRLVLVVFSLVCCISGCTYIDQKLTVNPDFSITGSNIGKNKEVALKVTDEREDSLVGDRGYMYKGAKISSDQDMAQLFIDNITKGLQSFGFVVVPYDEQALDRLIVEIRAVKFEANMGFWTGGNTGTCSFKVKVINKEDTFEKMYRGDNEIRTAFAASQETISKVVNEAVEEALTNMFKDQQLLDFLAKNLVGK